MQGRSTMHTVGALPHMVGALPITTHLNRAAVAPICHKP